MPIHDWTRVEAGIFHAFHTAWVTAVQAALNSGLLPRDYYALAEQHAGRYITNVLTLHASPPATEAPLLPPTSGGLALAEAPPRVRRHVTVSTATRKRRRTVAIRHVSGHRLVALMEIVSPSNKDRSDHVAELAAKAASALDLGVHLLLVDLLPPGPHDPNGMHAAICRMLDDTQEIYDLPTDEPLTLASYLASPTVEAFLEHVAVGGRLPDMALFLPNDRYVYVPLEPTYETAFQGMPAFWREVLERPRSSDQGPA